VRPDCSGTLLNFNGLPNLIGRSDNQAYACVFQDWPGELVHVGMGITAALSPSHISILVASFFTAYEASRLAAGKSLADFAGSLVEFSLGVLLGVLYTHGVINR